MNTRRTEINLINRGEISALAKYTEHGRVLALALCHLRSEIVILRARIAVRENVIENAFIAATYIIVHAGRWHRESVYVSLALSKSASARGIPRKYLAIVANSRTASHVLQRV